MQICCEKCGAFMGTVDPLTDRSTDTTGLCVHCAEKDVELAAQLKNKLAELGAGDAGRLTQPQRHISSR